MRITALCSALAIGALGAIARPAHADSKKPLAATHELAALIESARSAHGAPAPDTGEIGLAASTRLARSPDDAAPPAPARPARYLTPGDVTEIMAPRAAEIERCYVAALGTSRRGGRLDLMFVIARDGHVVSLDSAAPGIPVVAAHQLHGCLRSAASALQFPARRNDTTAIVPYYFQRTDAPSTGPQLSCWNPRGC